MPPKEPVNITNLINLEHETETALEATPDEAKSKIVLPDAQSQVINVKKQQIKIQILVYSILFY